MSVVRANPVLSQNGLPALSRHGTARHGTALDWQRVSGQGEVYTTTTVRRKPERDGDYNVCMVELAEGARMMSRVTGIVPARVAIGMAVELFVGEIDDTPAVLCKSGEG